MKNVLLQLCFLLLVVMLSGYVMCLPVNKMNNTENLKKRGNFDYSKLATVINSSKSNDTENDTGTTIDVQMIPNETTEINYNLDERISEKSESDKSSSVSTNIQNEDNIQTANGTENSSELPMIGIDSKLDTTTKILSESQSSSTASTSENPIRSEKSDKEFKNKTSDKETSDTSKKNTDTINEMNLKSSPKNDLQPPSLSADGGKSSNEKPIIMDKPFIHPFDKNNYPFPYIPFHTFPFQFSDPFNNRPLIPTEHIATDNGNINFDYYRFPNKFDQDFFKYITDMIAENNEDGSFNFVKRFNDGLMENIEGYFDDVSGDNNFFIKGGYIINLPNGKESSVSYVIDDKGCLTWTH